MKNKALLWVLNVLIVIAFFSLLYILIKPQYREIQINANMRKLQSNMFTVQAGIERYISFHKGDLPLDVETIYDNIEEIEIPVNPYTGEKMSQYDIVEFKYGIPKDVEDDSPESFNAKQTGEPGRIGVGLFTPLGGDSLPTRYGIIGFDRNGDALIIEEGKKERVFLLNG